MNRVEVAVRHLDQFQQRHPVLAFPFAVIQKYGNDQAGGKAVVVAYYGLFSLFPLMLLLTTILGFVLADYPSFEHQVLHSALAKFPVIGTQLQSSAHPLTGNALALSVGIVGTVYGVQGVGQAALNAMHTVWNIPYKEWPNFWLRRIRGFVVLAVLGFGTVISTLLTSLTPAVIHGAWVPVWSLVASILVNFGVFTAAFIVLTSEPLGWRDVAVGAGLATAFWEALQAAGGWYVRRELTHATAVYGTFALVIGLLSFLYLATQLTLLAAEINVVRRYRLWPRTITQPPLSDGDRRTYIRLAMMEERRPEVDVTAGFNAEADRQPLDE
ncbi:MAG TPA: YihY/virulence factor BrkB family protein [Acidimicrobiales bacterium]|jgi:YihY family inner membrane protein|nr:YihY/virulence factor BrkB family protein [Acidimicrobiales bacterium]